jgi:hypothetical protein
MHVRVRANLPLLNDAGLRNSQSANDAAVGGASDSKSPGRSLFCGRAADKYRSYRFIL